MKFETLDVQGVYPAIYAMRHPYESYARSDTVDDGEIGEADKDLSIRLQKGGPEHCKHLRMIHVWVDIEGPRYWLTELDTYRAGVEKISRSTMHTITKRAFVESDFAHDDNQLARSMLPGTLYTMNTLRDMYLKEEDPVKKKEIWRVLIQSLPQSYMQKRTYDFSYAALRNIVRQRKGHRLKEWAEFIDWCHTLPHSWMIFDDEPPQETAQ